MSDPRVERLLRDFLEAEAEARARGITLESLYRLFQTMANRIVNLETVVGNVVTRLKSAEEEVKILSARSPGPNWRPADAEITGVFSVEELGRRELRRDSDARFLRRKAVGWVGSALGAAILFIAGLLAAHLFH